GNALVVQRPLHTFEANVPFELRYMIDARLNGCQWFSVAAGSYRVVDNALRDSRCALEVELLPGAKLQPLPMSGEHGQIARMRMLSFDIEVCKNPQTGGLPTPRESPVIMICAELDEHGRGSVHKAAFALRDPVTGGGYMAVEGANDTYVYDREEDLLLAFRAYVLQCDPECFTGWNINKFYLCYLTERAKRLGIEERFADFSRVRGKRCWMRASESTSRAHGTRETYELLCAGRYTTDGMDFMQRCVMKKYRSYSLNAIAEAEVGDRKLDVDHTQIPPLFHSDRPAPLGDQDRTRLLSYCMKDTMLPLVILRKFMAVINMVEQARVTGIPIKWLLTRGQGVKTFSNMLRYKAPTQFIPSRSPRVYGSRMTTGGHVEEPRRGFYRFPIISLDFGSLYPSIMRAHNICYSTKVARSWAERYLDPDQYWSPFPSGEALPADYVPPPSAEEEARAQRKPVAKADKKRGRVDPKQRTLLMPVREVEAEVEEEEVVEDGGDEDHETGPAVGMRLGPSSSRAAQPHAKKRKSKKERDREAKEAAVAGKPTDFVFVKREVAQGVLPAMLDTLVATRAEVKL